MRRILHLNDAFMANLPDVFLPGMIEDLIEELTGIGKIRTWAMFENNMTILRLTDRVLDKIKSIPVGWYTVQTVTDTARIPSFVHNTHGITCEVHPDYDRLVGVFLEYIPKKDLEWRVSTWYTTCIRIPYFTWIKSETEIQTILDDHMIRFEPEYATECRTVAALLQ